MNISKLTYLILIGMVLFVRPVPIEPGQRFTRLTAEEMVGSTDKGLQWRCRCDCGAVVVVLASRLNANSVRSCGCLKRETAAATGRRTGKRHGHFSHGVMSITYESWRNMIARCENPNDVSYPEYGGRGIHVHVLWRWHFSSFLAAIGPRPSRAHTLDRVDPNGHYVPGNVRWATGKQQGRNRRNNRNVTIAGETKTIAEWAELSGLHYYTIWHRVERDWPEHLLLADAHRGLSVKGRV